MSAVLFGSLAAVANAGQALIVLVVESVRRRAAPPARAVAGAVIVAIGLALVLLG